MDRRGQSFCIKWPQIPKFSEAPYTTYLLTTLGTEYRFTRVHDVSSTPLKTNTATTKPITTTSAGASTTTVTQSLQIRTPQKAQISTSVTPIIHLCH